MITIQHTTLYYLGLSEARKNNSKQDIMAEFHAEVPFVLLPDGIRAYIGQRQAGHFELLPDETDGSWMEYPSESVLKQLSKENVTELVKYYIAEGYPRCVIGEKTDLDQFDIHNWDHKHYHSIRIHLLQDCVLDTILRERMIDATERFKDKFIAHHNNSIEIDGAELRKQIAMFERLGFLKLVGAVYKRTGTLLNREWFDKNVLPALLDAYPEDLAQNTYKFMKIDDELNDRINNLEFDLTAEDKEKVSIASDLDRILDEMYAVSYRLTRAEL